MTSCERQFGYSLLVVILIVAVIAILGMIGAQKIFDKGSQVPDRGNRDGTTVPAGYIPTGMAAFVKDPSDKALAKAVRETNTVMVRLCLKGGANPNARTSTGGTPLHRTAARGLVDIARLLLEHEAEVNALNSKSITPLHLAAGNGHFEIVQLLIDYDANIGPKNDDGQTPLAMVLQALAATEPADTDARRRYEKTIDLLRSWGAK
jgi:ankyrin repeat protein